jgi:hypothetical protein
MQKDILFKIEQACFLSLQMVLKLVFVFKQHIGYIVDTILRKRSEAGSHQVIERSLVLEPLIVTLSDAGASRHATPHALNAIVLIVFVLPQFMAWCNCTARQLSG